MGIATVAKGTSWAYAIVFCASNIRLSQAKGIYEFSFYKKGKRKLENEK